jgi:hypothetical protein
MGWDSGGVFGLGDFFSSVSWGILFGLGREFAEFMDVE